MWREETGFLEMFLAYYSQFDDGSKKAHRDFLFDVLCVHEESLAVNDSSRACPTLRVSVEPEIGKLSCGVDFSFADSIEPVAETPGSSLFPQSTLEAALRGSEEDCRRAMEQESLLDGSAPNITIKVEESDVDEEYAQLLGESDYCLKLQEQEVFYLVEFPKEKSFCVLNGKDVIADCHDEGSVVDVKLAGTQFKATIIASSTSRLSLENMLKSILEERRSPERVRNGDCPVVTGHSINYRRRLSAKRRYDGVNVAHQMPPPPPPPPPLKMPPPKLIPPSGFQHSTATRTVSDDEFKMMVLSQLDALRSELKSRQSSEHPNCGTTPFTATFSKILSMEELHSFIASFTPEIEKDLTAWLATAGGNGLMQVCRQVVNMLFCHDLQLRCNKSGKHGKTSIKTFFPAMVAAVQAIQKCSAFDAEQGLSRYLAGAADRYGGRQRRQHSSEDSLAQSNRSETTHLN